MRPTSAPIQQTSKQPGSPVQQPAPHEVRRGTGEPRRTPSQQPGLQAGYSLANLPLFPGGAVPGPRPGAAGPQFFDAQAFSPATARHAVSGATAGHFPFGDQISAEIRGAINPHTIPSVVVDKLPGLGVCQDGKVALRAGSGIDVARHELAHALGGDEATARRASHDSSVLSSLATGEGRSPVNGWAIGFEFQTHAEGNPKTYEKRVERAPAPPRAENEQEDEENEEERLGEIVREYYQPLDGHHEPIYKPRPKDWKIEVDSGDIEVITRAQPETDQGRENLSNQLDEIALEMQTVQVDGKAPGYKLYQVGSKEIYVQHTCGLKKFTAHPQATVGMNFEAVPTLISRLTSQQQIDHPYMQRKVWAKDQIGFDWTHPSFKQKASLHGMTVINASQQQVDGALSQHAELTKLPRLRAILHILASYAALGMKVQTSKTPQVKNIAAFMSRNNLHEVYKIMSPLEKRTYQTMLQAEEGAGSMAAAFGLPGLAALQGTKLLRQGAMNWGQITLFNVLNALPNRDLLGDNNSQKSIHKVDPYTYSSLLTDAKHQFDIGESSTQGQVERKGMFLELRAIKREVPWDEWKGLALAIFDQVRAMNAAVENQKNQQFQTEQQRQHPVRSRVPELLQQQQMQRAQQHRQRMQAVHAQIPARSQQVAESLAVRNRLQRAQHQNEQATRALLNRPPPPHRKRRWFHGLPKFAN